MKHPNQAFLEQVYKHFARGEVAEMLARLPAEFSFQAAGRSPIAGKFTQSNFAKEFFAPLRERCGGHFNFQVHDVLASDRHGVVLATLVLDRGGKKVELRQAHVWRGEGGKLSAAYVYDRDLYRFDELLA